MPKNVELSDGAGMALGEIAASLDLTEQQVIESLLHYAGSILARPGSWEANGIWEPDNYFGEEPCADQWFDDEKSYLTGRV